MLDARDENNNPLDIDYVKAEVLPVLLAGADTTGTAFQAMVHYITTDDLVYEKLMAELDGATRSGYLSSLPQYSEVLEHCPYYIACVKESMRPCPSAPNIFPRTSPEGGYTIDGHFIPGGVEVTCNPWIVHRDKKIYGDDATEFKPDRWLTQENAKMFDKYSMVFGYGPRSCLGRDIALMELYKAPLQVIFQFPRYLAAYFIQRTDLHSSFANSAWTCNQKGAERFSSLRAGLGTGRICGCRCQSVRPWCKVTGREEMCIAMKRNDYFKGRGLSSGAIGITGMWEDRHLCCCPISSNCMGASLEHSCGI